jgi:hypothetical protein
MKERSRAYWAGLTPEQRAEHSKKAKLASAAILKWEGKR